MSEATERLLVRIDATTEQLRRELKKADDAVASSASKMEAMTSRIGKAFSGLGAIIGSAGLGLALRKVFQETAESEKVIAQLNATLASTGGAAGKSSEELIKTASGLQKITTYGDEAIIGMQSLLLTFKNVKTDNFDRATKAILDMSTAMGQDLKSSTIQLGKALNDPIKGLSALSRVGIQFSEDQKQLITTMAETGRVAEAQVMILEELESQFGGSAEAARNTLGGALEGLKNAFGELFEAEQSASKGMIQSINELEQVISNPAIKDAIDLITESTLALFAAIRKVFEGWNILGRAMADGWTALRNWDPTGILADDLDRLGLELVKTGPMLTEITVKAKKWGEASKSVAEATAYTAVSTKKATDAGKEYARVSRDIIKDLDKLRDRHEKANQQLTDGIKELDELVASNDRYIEQLEFEVSLLGKTAREQALLTVEHEHAGRATDEQMQKIRALNAQLYDAEEATKAAAEAQKPFQDALQGTVERIDSAFASAWQGAFDSFNDFADGIKDSFKNLIGELLHIAITRPIVMQIGAAVGLGGASGAASAGTGGLSSLASLGQSAYSLYQGGFGGMLGSIGSAYQGAGSMLGSWATSLGPNTALGSFFGEAGLSATSRGLGYSYGGTGAGLANVGINMGAGILGGYAGTKAFGETSGIGSTAGGLVGSIWGPIGTAIGSFIGTGLERGLGNIFGFGGAGENDAGRADLNLATGSLKAYGVGKKFDQDNLDAATELATVIKAFSDVIGGSSAQLNIKVGGRSGLAFNGQNFGTDSEEFLSAAIKEVVSGATTLSATLKKLVSNFSGTAEETMTFAQAVVSLSQQIAENPVTKAVENFATVNKLAALTSRQIYEDQRKSLEQLIYSFDGSAEAAVALNNALVQNRTAAYEMALAIEQIGQSINQAANDSISYFQEQTRTPDEQLKYMQSQLEFGAALLPGIKDPAQLAQWGQALLDINKRIFDAGPDDLQRSNVNTFIDFADFIRNTITERLGVMSTSIETDQANLSQQLGAMLEVSAAGFQAPADTMLSAAQMMYLAVQNFINNGGQYSQVVA